MTEDQLLVEVAEGLAWLTFSNPAKHNALTIAMSRAVTLAVQALEEDREVRAVVMCGAGGRAFMSGADIDEQGSNPNGFRTAAEVMLKALAEFRKPLIAMIDGYCLGGGLSVALQADVRIASTRSTFAVPAARLGIAYPFNSIGPLLALAGPAAAADILYTGRRLTSDEAREIGLVQRVLDPEQLRPETEAYAGLIARNAPLSVRASKATIQAARPTLGPADLDLLRQLALGCEQSHDYQEGQAAFHERREPRFEGT